jgi:hypothetical protein
MHPFGAARLLVLTQTTGKGKIGVSGTTSIRGREVLLFAASVRRDSFSGGAHALMVGE